MPFDPESLRRDFPALQQSIDGKPVVYLDNACMTAKPQPVLDAMTAYYTDFPGCHGRAAHEFARRTTDAYEAARASVARFIGARSPRQVVFTKNTTESINIVAQGTSWREGDVVLTSDMEHNSNLLPWYRAAKASSGTVRHYRLAEDSSFDADAFDAALTDEVRLVAVFHTSNVTGVSMPLQHIVQRAHSVGARVLLDASQGLATDPVDVAALGVDYLVLSMHKLLGPTGVGVLYGTWEALEALTPLLYGGEMISDVRYADFQMAPIPDRFEAGLQNYAGIIGAGRAADYLREIPAAEAGAHLAQLNEVASDGLAELDRLQVLGPADPAARHGIVNFVMPGTPAEHVGRILDESRNVMVRAGHHCVHSWYHARGHDTSVRASFFIYNTVEEARLLAKSVKEIALFFG